LKFLRRMIMEIRESMLPVLGPKGGEEEVQAIREVIESGWWGKGPKVAEFEQKFAEMVGHKYAVAVTSNSHGQDLIMKAMRYKGIDVINPAISFIATAMVPLWNDCTSNIVDVRKDTLCIDPDDVERYKKPNSEVLISVDEAGVFADYKNLRKKFGGFILQDCAHSCWTPGAGLDGDAAVWSFQAVKTMPAGDGGMITTNDKQLADKCREMTWFGVSSTWSRAQGQSGKPGYAWDYEVDVLGYKYYMIDIIAAICLEQMKKLPAHLEFRRHVQARYNAELNPMIERPPHSETVQYYVSRVPSEHRDSMIDYLAAKKIHTSVHFKPLYKYAPLTQDREYPVCESEWVKLLTLPCHNRMVEEDIDYVIYWVNKYCEENI
jgi:perosamine synthetase